MPSSSSLISLPTEILLVILHRLDYITLALVLPRVCRRLRAISLDITSTNARSKDFFMHPLLSENHLVIKRTRHLYDDYNYLSIGSSCIGIIFPGDGFVSLGQTPFAKDPAVYNLPGDEIELGMYRRMGNSMATSGWTRGEQTNMMGLVVEIGNLIRIADTAAGDVRGVIVELLQGKVVKMFDTISVDREKNGAVSLIADLCNEMWPYFDLC